MCFSSNMLIYILKAHIVLPLLLSSPFLILVGCILEQEEIPPAPVSSSDTTPASPEWLSHNLPLFNNGLTESPPDLDLIAAAGRLRSNFSQSFSVNEISNLVHTEGSAKDFWLTDIASNKTKKIRANLIAISDNAYWYFDERLSKAPQQLQEAIDSFEFSILPEFDITMPARMSNDIGIDPKITILHTYFEGAAGYFNSFDQYTAQVNPYSNQQRMIYMNLNQLDIGSSSYLGTLSHELQHLRHSINDPTEESWVNEGISEVMRNLSGYSPGFLHHFITAPSTQLNYWPSDKSLVFRHYGASTLFIDYLLQNYGGYENLKTLVSMQGNGIEGIDQYLSAVGFNEDFDEVFNNWVLANFLDTFETPPFNYPLSNIRIMPSLQLDQGSSALLTTPQYSAEYILLKPDTYPSTLYFQGSPTVQLMPSDVFSGNGCWWSNRGDLINTSLTGPVDLKFTDSPILDFWMWHDIEKDWDYLYLSVSEDDGTTWSPILTKSMSQNPASGASLSSGYTGTSDNWERHSADLSSYSGKAILIRFDYITDESVNESGVCIDDISISGVGIIENAESESSWESSGFIRTNNRITQKFTLQIIELGESHAITNIDLDANGKASFNISEPETQSEFIVVVSPTTRKTSIPSEYTLSLTAQ